MITQEQIDAWKKEHGEVSVINIKGQDAIYLRPLTNQEFAICISMYGKRDVYKANELVLSSCYLGGNDIVKEGLKNADFKGEPQKAKVYRTAVQAAGSLTDFLEYSTEQVV